MFVACLVHTSDVHGYSFLSVGLHELRFPELAQLQSLAKLGGHRLDQVVPLENDGNPSSHCIVGCSQRGSFLALKCLKGIQTSRPESRRILAGGTQNLFMQDHAGKGQVTTLFNSVQFQIFALDPPYSSLNQVLVKDPAKLNVARFQRISSFLEVVVGLLLGFFLSSSMQRLGIQFVRFQNYNRFDRNHLLL